jgi:hypothetical protein
MRTRQLQTENRILRQIAGNELSVTLTDQFAASFDMPTMGTLALTAINQSSADTDARRQAYLEIESELLDEQNEIRDQLMNESDPLERDRLRRRSIEVFSQIGNYQTDRVTEKAIEMGVLKGVDELTEKYGDLLNFDRPMSEEEAEILYKGKKEEAIRNAIIQAGPKGIIPGAVQFAGGIAAMAVDPLEVASMFIPIVGQAGRGRAIAKYGKIKGSGYVGAREGGFGAAITEPVYFSLSQNQQLDYTMSDALFNVGAGFFLGGAIGTVGGVISARYIDDEKAFEMAEFERIQSEMADLGQILEARKGSQDISTAKIRNMYQIMGGPVTHDLAVRQFALDQNLQVDLIAPKVVKRPETLSEFVRSKGGINDQDPAFRGELAAIGLEGARSYKNSKGTQINRVSNTSADANLDEMADLAYQNGFLDSRNPSELVERLKEETQNTFTFSKADQFEAEQWRQYHQGKDDFEREVEFRNEIRSELEMFGVKNVTDDEVALIADRMARTGEDAVDAAQAVAIKVEDVKSRMIAETSVRPEAEKLADFEASARADQVSDEIPFPIDEINERREQMIETARAADELTDEQKRSLEEMDEIDRNHEARVEVIQAGIRCVARS